MDHESRLSGYVKPTEAELKARKRRNYAIGGALALFCVAVFVMMIIKIGGST